MASKAFETYLEIHSLASEMSSDSNFYHSSYDEAYKEAFEVMKIHLLKDIAEKLKDGLVIGKDYPAGLEAIAISLGYKK